jgi:hypothetical protein
MASEVTPLPTIHPEGTPPALELRELEFPSPEAEYATAVELDALAWTGSASAPLLGIGLALVLMGVVLLAAHAGIRAGRKIGGAR